MTVEEILSRITIFQDLPLQEIKEIAKRARRRVFSQGDPVFFSGDPGHCVYFIGSGKVKIHTTREDGEETVIGILSDGEFFGELSVLDGQPRSADVTCLEPTEIAVLDREEFLSILDRYPSLSRKVLIAQAARLRATDRMLDYIASLDVYGRVAAQLMELAQRYGRQTPNGIELDLRITQQDLAGMVGASRESVNKVLNHYRNRGIVSFERGRITILKPTELKRRAEG